MKRQSYRWFILLLVMLLCVTSQSQGQLQKVNIASGGHVVHFLPLDLAVALGYFKNEGLDPDITYLDGGTATAQALISKQVDFSTNGIEHAFKAAAQGKNDLRMVVLLNQTPGMVLVVDSKYKDSVKTIADLKGKRLGVTSLGSASHMVLAFLLSKNGVSLEDATITKAGTSTFPPALKNGSIDGGIAVEPFASIMVEQGNAYVLQRLITLEDSNKAFGGPYSLTGILTRQDVIDANPELVQKVVNVHVRVLKWMQTHTEQEIASVLSSEVIGSDRKQYVKTLQLLKEFYSPDGTISEEGADNVLTAMKVSGILQADFKSQSQQYINKTFVEQAASFSQAVKMIASKLPSQLSPNHKFSIIGVVVVVLLIVVDRLTKNILSFISDKIFTYLRPFPKWIFDKVLFQFFLRGVWNFLLDMRSPGSGSRRPWLIFFIAVALSLFATLSYWHLLHDWLKWPAKSIWFGILLVVWVSFATLNKVWQKTKSQINFDKGLKKFTKWVVDAIDSYTETIYIAVNTPLIHIFHDMPEQEQLSSYGSSDNSLFEKEFCYPFKDALAKCRSNLKDVKFLYYPPVFLREKSPWLPISGEVDFKSYTNSIDQFAMDVVTAYARGIDTKNKKQEKVKQIFRETIMLPLWIAVIKRHSAQGRPAEHTLVLALTDRRDLQKPIGNVSSNKEKKKFAGEIAKNIMCIRSTDSNTVNFFEGVFEELWNEENLSVDIILELLHRSRKGHGIEILLREQYNANIHGNLKAGTPSEILYSTKK
jgi:NitT/TauT family transport system substrate-binding protein